ncbi:bifunctional DNA primase/polymerase [Inquilinus limosus]|uniref:SF3 helicase domain-containing protein n=1 Tax=Inquilinus limosus MP06 TaxID=1398085 RepID=A0A0A0DGL5_9PROT|nr:bifunctional DNA primase/polymerase [Inquilinus limosus]KGM36142.1 hypothetical protein P409_00405 [Inquilinus limosus MP06]
MTQRIFGDYAPIYWANGLPAIPLMYQDKRPIIQDWSRFSEVFPTDQEQEEWTRRYFDNNIGIVLGPQSGLTMIDIDTEDEGLIKDILEILPPSPWHRKGRKGVMLAYKFSGIQTFRIKEASGKMLVECLSSKTQIVLPPSIHPDTKRPYEANCNLFDVVGDLVELPSQVESLLRGLFKDRGIELSHSGWTRVTDYVSVGSRDVKMTSVAGFFAQGVTRGEMTVLEAMERMRAWHSTCTEKIAGDDVDIEKGVNNLIKFLIGDVLDKGKMLPIGWDAGLSDVDKKAMGLEFTVDNEEWDYERIRDYLKEEFEKFEPDTQGRMNAVEYVLRKISSSDRITSLDADRIFRYIVDVGGMRLNLSNLRRRVVELQKGDFQGINHTEIAAQIKKELEEITPHAHVGGNFWRYGGSHWEIVDRSELLRIVAERYGNYIAAKRAGDHKGVLDILGSLLPQQLTTDDVRGINFANGVLLENGAVVEHNPAFGMQYTLPYRFVPNIGREATRWHAFLERVWGADEDYEDKVRALQEAMCATMFGMGPRFQRAVLCYGVAKTGKSQLLTIVKNLMPSEARSACPPDMWGDKFAPATMYGKLINVCGELSETKNVDGQRFKQTIDGEEMAGQYKGQQIFHFRPRCMHWFASNHMPKTDDTSGGFNRRWLVLTFNSPIDNSERILDFGDIVAAEEREAIVSWVIEALPRVRQIPDFTLPESHKKMIDEMAAGNNSVRHFFMTGGRVTVDPTITDVTSEKKLYAAYWSFCISGVGARPVTTTKFTRRVRDLAGDLGFKEVPGGWSGLTVKDVAGQARL